MAASLRAGPVTLTTGTTIRIVDNGAGTTPRYIIESPSGQDAMGVTRWNDHGAFNTPDVIAILVAVGFLIP